MTAKTSHSDPIRVDFLPQHLLGTSGRIGMTFAPGKKDRGMYATWDRDLVADLERLVDVYRTSVLISLVEDSELVLLAIPDLSARAAAAGIELVRSPFRDGGIPSSLDVAGALIATVLDAARAGKNVVVHCRGGLGRTGLVAACCLVELGHGAAEAILLVRAARSGAVETRGQEQFIEAFAREARGTGRVRETGRPTLSRIRGCLLGGAIGDALGYPIEFEKSATAILAAHGNRAPRDLLDRHGGVGLVSDDTQMALFVAEGLIRGIQRHQDRGICSMPGSVQRALVRWYATQTGILCVMRGASARDGWWVIVDSTRAAHLAAHACPASPRRSRCPESRGSTPLRTTARAAALSCARRPSASPLDRARPRSSWVAMRAS